MTNLDAIRARLKALPEHADQWEPDPSTSVIRVVEIGPTSQRSKTMSERLTFT